ncbi:MAG: NAD+ synthase [Candidatus Omnitrophota bacterium]
MKSERIRLALAQINLTVGDFEGNAEKVLKNIKLAHEKQADIIVFPELTLCGYPPEDLLLKPHFIRDNKAFLKKIAEKTPEIIVLVGLAHEETQSIYNSCAVIYDKRILGFYHKKYLPNYAVFDEKRYFREGEKYLFIKYGNTILNINICEDIWIKHEVRDFNSEVDLIINLSASPYYRGKIKLRRKMLSARAKEAGAYLAYCNLTGAQDELVFDGGSLVFNPDGRLVFQSPQFKEELSFIDIDLDCAGAEKMPAELNFGNKEKCSVINIPVLKGAKSKKPLLKSKQAPLLKEEAEIYEALKSGLKNYVAKNHFKKVVLGLSGGIDSALCAVIAADALGKDNVLAALMPSQFTSFATLNDATVLAKKLDIKFSIIPIDSLYLPYLDSLENIFKDTKKGVAEENLQARVRGNLLMAISNKFGYLVLTTGNKSETSVGYCTLYGDMAGGFAVLKDVPKTLVYKLSKYRNSLIKENIIPLSIIKRAPSAELKLNQKDQDTLPPYDILDKILKLYVEQDKSLQEIIDKGFDGKVVKKVITLVDRNEYKRRQAPPGVRITPKAFGRDRRMPISNQYSVK